MHGGEIVASVLEKYGVTQLFTLCGGHISPILVGCKARGIRVIDVRHEVTAVFAADAAARLTGIPGVAAVTAGPGATNTLTAVKNAQLAQSPVVILGGAAATALRGRGALQDIDQMALFRPHVKWARSVSRVREIAPALTTALRVSEAGVPGPVFIELPVDVLYPESVVREWYGIKSPVAKSMADRAVKIYLSRHVNRLFAGAAAGRMPQVEPPAVPAVPMRTLHKAAGRLHRARRPLMLIGSQAVLRPGRVGEIVRAVEALGIPVYLSGMARGLMGRDHPLHLRHRRRAALKEADLVILAGVPCDFRLDYGQHIRRDCYLISANRSSADLRKNRRPDVGVRADAGEFLIQLAAQVSPAGRWAEWIGELRASEASREAEIARQAEESGEFLNPVQLCREMDLALEGHSLLVADGGDFVATASYTIRPPGPLRWLDPGVFGTLGVGAGFAIGAKVVMPEAEIWIIYGDGSAGYSLAEFDTFVRHKLPVIAVVGNDASWRQIAREQVVMLKDDVGTVLRRADYDKVAEGFGGCGFRLEKPEETAGVLRAAKAAAGAGTPVLVNAMIGETAFRKGSISM